MTAPPAPQHRGGFQAAKESWLKLIASYPNLSGADCAVAIALSTYINFKSGDAWPSLGRLATDTNRSRSTVWRSVRRLESLTLLAVIHARGRKKSNRYRPKLGDMNTDPRMLRRPTSPRGKTLRTRNEKTANSQQKDCGFAARTSEEEQKNLGAVAFREEAVSSRNSEFVSTVPASS
jgi:hypothetical protein